MPWYVALYLAIFTVITGVAFVAGWLDGKTHRRQLVLDALDNLGWIALATAYWREEMRALLGVMAVPLFLGCFIWFFKSMEPAIEWLRRRPGLNEDRVREIAWFGFSVNLITVAPAMYWGLQVCIDAVAALLGA
jgi:hypothetical protein